MVKIFESTFVDYDAYAEEIHSVLNINAKNIFDKSIIDDLKSVYELSYDEIKELCNVYYNKYKDDGFVISNGVLVGYSGNDSDYLVIPDDVYKIDDGVFSGTPVSRVDFNNVSIIGNSAFENSKIFNVKFNNNLVSIGNSAFFNTRLRTVDIPNSVEYIGKNAFANNIFLTSVKLHPLDYLGNYAFAHCNNLSKNSIDTINNVISKTKSHGNNIIDTVRHKSNYTLKELLSNKTVINDIINFISSNYGCSVDTKRAFILPNGDCVATAENQPHYTLDDEIYDYLEQEHNIILDVKNNGTFGSLIMDSINCIRVNCVFENYVYLPKLVNNVQYDTLCEWLDFFFETTHFKKPITITNDTGWQESFSPKEMTQDDIIKYLKRNYKYEVNDYD